MLGNSNLETLLGMRVFEFRAALENQMNIHSGDVKSAIVLLSPVALADLANDSSGDGVEASSDLLAYNADDYDQILAIAMQFIGRDAMDEVVEDLRQVGWVAESA